jgi:hypothetical protein
VGPWAPRLLTHYGAEVIHVERAGGWDDHRYNAAPSIVSDEPRAAQLPGMKKVYADPQFNTVREESAAAGQVPGEKKLYAAPYFNTLHHGKLAISLNTKKPEGLKLVERLIGVCDALVEISAARCCRAGASPGSAFAISTPAARVHELSRASGTRASGSGLPQLRANRAGAGPGISLASGASGKPPAGWGFLLPRRHGRLDGRPSRLIKGSSQGEEEPARASTSTIPGHRRRDVHVGYLHARLPGEWPTQRAAPTSPPGNRSIFPR